MNRRLLIVGAGAVAFAGTLWQSAAAFAAPAQNGPGPFGPLQAADANGIQLPVGFSSRIVARSSQVVSGTGYTWHSAPDGGACFADGSGWIYVSNSEVTPGGASALRLNSSGTVTSAYRILSNTRNNCAGGATPWNKWLSCEEVSLGYVFETDPWGGASVRRDAMGKFKHEAAACDPVRQVIYMTEDESSGDHRSIQDLTNPERVTGDTPLLPAWPTPQGCTFSHMNRRSLIIGAGAVAFSGSLWQSAAMAAPAQNGPSPYGPLQPADANGIQLPAGFTSRIVARSSQVVPGTGYTWHSAPDGGACFVDGSGWIYVSNSEATPGGASALRFDSSGTVTSAYRVLSDTRNNCAGGATPWNTWLSCEEVSLGFVYETDPWGGAPTRRDAMGKFAHEAAACDPVRQAVYMTEDESGGCFYRFVPTTWGDLSAGTLQVLVAGSATSGSFTWATVPDPDGKPKATRKQVTGSKKFSGGEGCHYAYDTVWFTTKGDNRVWQLNLLNSTYELAYDDSLVNPGTAPLSGVDNITGSSSGDLYVAEDGGNMEINIITPDDIVAPVLRITGQSSSEICGPAFNPAGNRLYLSSQRGTSGSSSGGITYEITGPFRT